MTSTSEQSSSSAIVCGDVPRQNISPTRHSRCAYSSLPLTNLDPITTPARSRRRRRPRNRSHMPATSPAPVPTARRQHVGRGARARADSVWSAVAVAVAVRASRAGRRTDRAGRGPARRRRTRPPPGRLEPSAPFSALPRGHRAAARRGVPPRGSDPDTRPHRTSVRCAASVLRPLRLARVAGAAQHVESARGRATLLYLPAMIGRQIGGTVRSAAEAWTPVAMPFPVR